jgi:hypothetical protein
MLPDPSEAQRLLRRIRIWLGVFIAGLVLSGLTAFAIETQLDLAVRYLDGIPRFLQGWIRQVHAAVTVVNDRYPFLSYGTDWLAYSHLAIAVAFIGPCRNPVKNRWVIEFGMIACLGILPTAFIAGHVREIPVYWRLIDSAFGVLGIVPLLICHRAIRRLERLERPERPA